MTRNALKLAERLEDEGKIADMGRKPVMDTKREAAKELRKLYQENLELKKKADRYDWLRSQPNDTTAPRSDIVFWEPEVESANCGIGLRLEEADRKIDEAMKVSLTFNNQLI